MPVLLHPDPQRSERLLRAERSNQFIARKLSQWMDTDAGKFAIVCNGELVAMERDPTVAKAKAREIHANLSDCIMIAIPKRGASHYF